MTVRERAKEAAAMWFRALATGRAEMAGDQSQRWLAALLMQFARDEVKRDRRKRRKP